MSTETKTRSFLIKATGTVTTTDGQEFGQIECYGAIVGNVDEDKDLIQSGAFKRTLRAAKDRAVSRSTKYVLPMLWQHDTHEIIGGWYDVSEDSTGLKALGDINLATQRGREYYALAKSGMTDQFSIIYDIPTGGAHYDKSGVRNLTELRLFSIDPVTFAANDATFMVNVKAAGGDSDMLTKAASQEDTDAQKARSEKYGIGIKDNTNVTKPGKYSKLSDDDFADPVNYSYPLDTKAHADNAASRFGDQDNRDFYTAKEQGIIDKRIAAAQKKFGEDKGSRRARSMKTFEQHFNDATCADLLRDWQDIVLCAFTAAVYDAFQIGDQPEADVDAAVTALKSAVDDWVKEAVEADLSTYLDAQGYDGGTEYTMQNGTSSYGWMSRQPAHSKAMTAADATTGGFTAEHVSKLTKALERNQKAVDTHASTVSDLAENVRDLVGQGQKAGRSFSASNTQALSDHADALDAATDTLTKAVARHMKSASAVADDLATVLQGSEAAYGSDPGTPADGQQEGSKGRRAPLITRAPSLTPSQADTLEEKAVAAALASIKALRTQHA